MRYLIKLPANTPGLYAEGSGLNWKIAPVTGAAEFENAVLRKARRGEMGTSADKTVTLNSEMFIVTGKGMAVSRIDGIAVTALQVLSGGDDRGTLGYIVAQPDGQIKKYKTDDLLSFCGSRTRQHAHGVANMIYVPGGSGGAAHLKNYAGHEVGVSVYQVAPKQAPVKEQAEIVKRVAPQAAALVTPTRTAPISKPAEPQADKFTPEQQHEIDEGNKNGVDTSVYAIHAYSAKRMKYIRHILEAGKDPAPILPFEMDDDTTFIYVADIKHGRDITPYYNAAYKSSQAREVRLGYYSGVDISQFSDPSIMPSDMIEVRVRLESGLWDDAWGRGGSSLQALDDADAGSR